MGIKVGRREREMGMLKIIFWKVAGLKNKNKKFWRELEEWNVLMETWMDVKGWEKMGEEQDAKELYLGGAVSRKKK